MDRTKKTLITLLVIGALATIGAGTYATFTAQTTNQGNTFATGTLVLSNKANAGTACVSTGAGTTTDTNSNNCSAVVALAINKPGASASGTLQLTNGGSLDAAALSVYAPSCATADTTAAQDPNNTGGYHGSASGNNMCTVVYMAIEEDTSLGAAVSCVYGTTSGSGCAAPDSSHAVSSFVSSYTSGAPLSLGGTPALAKGASRYFKVTLLLDSTAGNVYQGKASTFDLDWQIS